MQVALIHNPNEAPLFTFEAASIPAAGDLIELSDCTVSPMERSIWRVTPAARTWRVYSGVEDRLACVFVPIEPSTYGESVVMS